MTDQRLSYVGQNVYVGVDVHKDTYTVTCVYNKRIVKTATVQADPAGLAASLPRWFQGATLSSVYDLYSARCPKGSENAAGSELSILFTVDSSCYPAP